MVVGSAHTRVLVRDWVLVRDVGSTNAFEAVRRKAAVAGKMRPSIFVVQHDARTRHGTARTSALPKSGYVAVGFQQQCALR